ncbi:hypothetical protein J2S09_002827 [Bacillus fengqiuensis]|nr:hypothetical protein [Bacillus fengqiuensis]
MKKVTKGALSMVLAGSVTFAVTNALLGDQISNLLTGENALIRSGEMKKEDGISQAEKTVKDQMQTTNVKGGQTKLSHDVPASEEAFNNRSKSNTINLASTNKTTTKTPAVATKPAISTKTLTATTTPKPTRTNTTNATPAASTKPAASAKAPTTTSAPKPTGTNTTSATPTPAAPPKTTTPTPVETNTTSPITTTTNHGQEVSQAAKEKAASRQDTKENNGKNM